MFKRLKMELILINVISLSIILSFVFSGIYILTKMSIDTQTRSFMESTAETEKLIGPLSAADKAWGQNNTFFFRLDRNQNFINYSATFNVSKEDISMLLDYVNHQTEAEGLFYNEQYNLKYLKYPKNDGEIIVFLDNRIESFILNAIITRSLFIGLISLTSVLLISWHWANKAIKPVKKNWEDQMEFVADASHELRTPIAVITSNLEVVLDNEEETVRSQSHWLNNIKEELERVHKLVNDLLLLARYDANEEIYISESFDILSLINNLVVSFQPLATKHSIHIAFDYFDETPIYLLGNSYRMKQLLTILIDNAIQYNQENGNIIISVTSQNNLLSLSVSDTGEGISPEHLTQIFERFYRVDKSRSRLNGGSGLGLSIAKCIVTEHKGKISVSSTLGKGSRFTMTFPIEL